MVVTALGASAPVRKTLGRLLDRIDDLRGRRDPLVPPRSSVFVGEGDFRRVGLDLRRLFVELGGLRPEDDVLDVGSGIGRVAVGLTGFTTGRYEGFDVVRAGVEWSRQAITPRYPNFNFQLADVHNRLYNPGGRWKASEYRFPYDDAGFDFVILTSVFTHLLPADRDNYLSEIRRVLRPGGRVFATFFLLDEESEPAVEQGRASFRFRVRGDGYRAISERAPERAVAYDRDEVLARFREVGLDPVVYGGSWAGRESTADFQDVVVAVAAA
jgi:SAM-dependent methyltransferase